MIKVLNVVVDNHIGGIQNRILSIGKELKKQDIQIVILSSNGDGDFAEIARNSGFKVYQASIESPKFFTSFSNSLKNVLWILKFPIGVIETIRVIKYEDIEIVHVNGLLALHAVFAAKITGTRLIWHLISTIYPKPIVTLLKPYFRWANKIVLVTHNTIEYYLDNFNAKQKLRVIYEPVDLNYYKKHRNIEKINNETYKKYELSKDLQVIGFIGNINPQKGLEDFLFIAKELLKNGKYKLKFFIIGGAPIEHENYLRKLKDIAHRLEIDNDLFFTGRISDPRNVMEIMDIFLMTSRSEGTPLVILEAMAMEIPVIASDVGGISEQVSHGETGFIVSPKDNRTILKYLQLLLDDSDLKMEMGKKGRKKVEELYDIKKCVEKHKELYYEIF